MKAIGLGLTALALSLRLAVLVIVGFGIESAATYIDKSPPPMQSGLRAIAYGWEPWAWSWPEALPPGEFEVPLICPHELSEDRYTGLYNPVTLKGPPIIVVVGHWVAVHDQRSPRKPGPYVDRRILGGSNMRQGEQFCTFTGADGSFLVVGTQGRYFRLDANLNRLDADPRVERFGRHLIDNHPAKLTFAVTLLALGTWLVFRRKPVTWLSWVGLVVAACWLIPWGQLVDKFRG